MQIDPFPVRLEQELKYALAYAALAALPTCPIIEKIEDVQQFIREQKRPDYFL